jgi:hypothetical protein
MELEVLAGEIGDGCDLVEQLTEAALDEPVK